MRIYVNETLHEVPRGTTLLSIRDRIKPDADIIVYNGGVCNDDFVLQDGDTIVLIQRGEIPEPDELLNLMAARHTPGVHAVIRKATIGIAGLGGLGSAVAIALARIGIGRLILADYDVVEPSNLNRQQYFVDQIGQPKTAALKNNLGRINPYVHIETHNLRLTPENIPDTFAKVDILVEAFDTAEGKAMLVESFGGARPEVPIVTATGLAGHAPGNSIQTRKLGRNLYVIGDLSTAAAPGTGLMAPRVGIAAHHQANAVLRLLLGEDPVGT